MSRRFFACFLPSWPCLTGAGRVGLGLCFVCLSAVSAPASAQDSADEATASTVIESPAAVARSAYDCGDYDTAEHYYLIALQSMADSHDTGYSGLLNGLGTCYYMAGKFDRSLDVFKQLTKVDEELHGNESLQVANDLFNVTRAQRRQLQWDDAGASILRTLAIRRKLLGENHKLVAMSWMDLAVNYQRQGKLPEAEDAFLKTIAIREKLGNEPKFLAPAYRLYAKLLLQMQRQPEAQLFERRAEDIVPAYALP